ncbi:hypothetical protein MchiMG62_16220 [Methanoculleus chikugoensis]|uniref:DUF4352 domain-containing protein n=2 Tax=Methanoculleus chikugoensis TaxID=118126 RepID=A0ABN5XKF9_9EURY|nr:hypothetical protein MchiMG62_16220 [Methanoculleus chikugoensis]
MLMSKHHENALIFLGIAVCAGFLLTIPAVADSGQGLMALESGELLPFSPGNLSAIGDTLEPSDLRVLADEGNATDTAPVLPEEDNATETSPAHMDERDNPDPFAEFQDGENASSPPEEPLSESDAEPVMHAVPESTDRPVPVVGAPYEGTGDYDDERLAGLVETASIRLMRLSMEHAHALYLQDADAAAVAADDMHAFSVRLLGEVQPLQVSPERQPFKDEFVRSLEAYSAASKTLLDPVDTGEDAVPTAFRDLATASEGLENATRQAAEIQPTDGGISTMNVAASTFAVSTGPVVVAPPEKVLPLMDRHTYDDPGGENMISLLAESTRTATTYREFPGNESTPTVEAGEGRMFFLVAVKSTNLGHKGDSDLYTIESPARDAFVLEYGGTTVAPLDVPPFTTLGESFDKKPLERYESLKGYLYFDVPDTFEVSGATLRADLGYAGTPAWILDEGSGDAEAV